MTTSDQNSETRVVVLGSGSSRWRFMQLSWEELVQVSVELARLVAPATPEGTLAVYQSSGRPIVIRWIPSVAAIRGQLLVALLAVLLGGAMLIWDPSVNIYLRHIFATFMDSLGVANEVAALGQSQMLKALLYLVSLAALGAVFRGLLRALDFYRDRQFDPAHNTSYFARTILGILSGVILALVVASLPLKGDAATISITIVALIGGYNVDTVRTVLNRLASSVEALVGGGK